MPLHFNPESVDGLCFTCSCRGSDLCKKCMKLNAEKSEPGRWLNNHNEVDPEFRKLWEATKK